MKIRVLRAFLVKGERKEPGSLIDATEEFGREMVALGKAERAGEEPPAAGPMTVAAHIPMTVAANLPPPVAEPPDEAPARRGRSSNAR
jgi:hypothetical protein